MAKVSTSVYLEAAQIEALRARSALTGVPVAELIRRAVGRWLEPAPIDPLSVLAQEPGFSLASLTDAECVVLAMRMGLLPAPRVTP